LLLKCVTRLVHTCNMHSNCFIHIPCDVTCTEKWGAGVEYLFQEFNEPYAPS